MTAKNTESKVKTRGARKLQGNIGEMDSAEILRLLDIAAQVRSMPVVLFASSADGDQRPVFRALQIAGHLPATDEGAAAWGVLDVQARSLANSTMTVLEKMPDGVADANLAAAASVVECPGQRRRVEPKTGQVTIQDAPAVKIPLNMVRIGDIAVGGDDFGTDTKCSS